ncbi:MAG: RsmF rRNA methyltransferase first C-terminal domain-containing protein [Chloroflexi bacterium]|nr:RsmF rRNA methyltransferase first C-terminal domain-containing protein [Chloroflexota bacterium]
MPDIPAAFLERMQALLGAEFAEFRDALDDPSPIGLRINLLKITPQAFQALTRWRLDPVPWCSAGYYLQEADVRAGKHPYHWAGLYYLQEPSAMAAVEALSPQPGERILDLCAAPGGKATQIAARLQGRGLLVANDPVRSRAGILAENLARFGARNTVVASDAPERLAAALPGFFDRVLADAPCSEEGMFRRSAQARLAWSPKTVAGCARRQLLILNRAAEMVAGGGILVYSTCTFSPEENEDVVARFLLAHPNYELIPAHLPGVAERGRREWCSLPEGCRLPLEHAARLWPHRVRGDGHFIALMRRTDEPGPPPRRAAAREDPAAARAFRDFTAEALAQDLPGTVIRDGHRVFLVADGMPAPVGLRALWPGWHVGLLRESRLVPSHALALGLAMSDARRRLSLPPDGEDTARYLRGEPLIAAGEPGWVLVGAGEFPLGWGFRVGDTVKNHYPRHLRQMSRTPSI